MFSGGFYSDDFGYVAQDCKKCPNGSYVPYDQTPGKSVLDCKTCPQGKHVVVHKCDLPAVKALYARVKDISKPKENADFPESDANLNSETREPEALNLEEKSADRTYLIRVGELTN